MAVLHHVVRFLLPSGELPIYLSLYACTRPGQYNRDTIHYRNSKAHYSNTIVSYYCDTFSLSFRHFSQITVARA